MIDMSYSGAIKQRSWNQLQVKASGSQISLYVNGVLLDTIVNEALCEGKVAVLAETEAEQDHIKVLFDNLAIERLE